MVWVSLVRAVSRGNSFPGGPPLGVVKLAPSKCLCSKSKCPRERKWKLLVFKTWAWKQLYKLLPGSIGHNATHRERHERPLQTQLHAAARSVGQPVSWKPLPSPLRLGAGSLCLLFLLRALHHPLRGSYPIHAFVKSLYKAHFTWSDLSPGWTARTLFRLLVFTLHRDMLDALALQNLSFHPQWLPDLLCLLLSFMRTPPNSVQQNASFRLKYSDTVRKQMQVAK